jgi:hypothetical protein
MFDKKLYWKRRKEGLPGIENLVPAPKVTPTPGQHMVRIGGKVQLVNREKARRKFVDRQFTKRGFEYGIRIGGRTFEKLQAAKRKFAKEHKGERIDSPELARHKELYPLEINPNKSNHQRMLERKERRDAEKSARRAASSAA